MTMTMVRQDDMPARRRYRHERLAVLALLALGSNLGCGREMLRVPAGQVTSSMTPSSSPPMAARQAGNSGPPPVALRHDYGSSLDELFLSSYWNPGSYTPQLAVRPAPKPADEPTSPSELLAASQASRIPLPSERRPRAMAKPESAFDVAHIPPPRARRGAVAVGRRAGAMTLAEASTASRIALPKPPKARVRTQSSALAEASEEAGIALPIPPTRATGPTRVHRAEPVATAFETARIAPPTPVRARAAEAPSDLDSACVATQIPPPAAAGSRQASEPPPPGLPGLPPRQLDASVFTTPSDASDAPPPLPPSLPPPAEAPQDQEDSISDLPAAFEATRISPPKPVREPRKRSAD